VIFHGFALAVYLPGAYALAEPHHVAGVAKPARLKFFCELRDNVETAAACSLSAGSSRRSNEEWASDNCLGDVSSFGRTRGLSPTVTHGLLRRMRQAIVIVATAVLGLLSACDEPRPSLCLGRHPRFPSGRMRFHRRVDDGRGRVRRRNSRCGDRFCSSCVDGDEFPREI
jgi:hypothetical protein